VARLYSNENFPLQVVLALREAGHDVLTSFEAGEANRALSDSAVLAFAVSQERALLTLNRRDFVREHARSPDHAGIIVCTQDTDTSGQARRIDEAIRELNTLAGRLIRVNRPPASGLPS
jgi:hypothetical protein